MKKTTFLLFVGLILLLVSVPGCNRLENTTTSASQLILDLITGNDIAGEEGSTTIFSDVLTSSGGIFNDNAEATVRAVLLDPLSEDASFYQTIRIKRIFVEYSRPGGLDEQGRDIPYSFSQDVSITVDINAAVVFSFVLVQHTAKMEPPLVDLKYGQDVYKMEAKITLYGEDMAGNQVNPVSGSVSVWFANFADEN